ncbi:caspase family protein [Actinoplanes sp. Pm04-4]|uniref:Caspase family protein n=1 Tax=Paractinoplanes pyxinae TaxID=2997416 RepID=A0ABT4B7F4_9ACTN|nr:caspase family protein [Actinoplanes pyxinae]MCY1141538.1 caspase family protein [Actinoplanes pyxinae]
MKRIGAGMGERLFIGVATTRYPAHPTAEDRPELAAGLRAMRDLFVDDLGYTEVPGFGADLTMEQLRTRLGAVLTDPRRSAEDVITFYYTGHGVVEEDEFALLFPETTENIWHTGLPGSQLATWLLRGTIVRRMLIVLDTCHAGAGGIHLVEESLKKLRRQRAAQQSRDTAVVWGARPRQKAESLAFTKSFIQAVHHPASGGAEPDYLPLDYLVSRINESPPLWQEATLIQAGAGVGIFLPNPRFDPRLHGFDLRTRSDEQEKLREQEMVGHVWPRAQGLDAPAQGRWLFTGRTVALRYLSGWLSADPDDEPNLVITGGPGSGKSALLSRFFVLSDPKRRARIPNDNLGDYELPDVPTIERFIHARGMTATELLAGICEAVQVDATTVADLVAILRRRTGPPVTVVVDAVDEAANSREAVSIVLAPLLRNSVPRSLRLLIGTREHLVDALPARQINIDSSEFADPASVTEYARRCLVDLVTTSPYRNRQSVAAQVAEAIGAAAGTTFLVALIVARTFALRPAVVPDPSDLAWRGSLPGRAAEGMQFDIDERLGERAADARNLLRPLAYAQGMGLPWENVWGEVASTMAGRSYTDDDIQWLEREAGYYIIETKEAQRSCYRLFHESLAEHLRDGDDAEVHRRIVKALRDLVPAGVWRDSHPYIRRYFAGHAAEAGEIDSYMNDPEFLMSADRGRLLTAALRTRTVQGRRAAIAFQQASQASSGDFASRASYLELAAHQYRADELATEIKRRAIPRPWSTAYATWTPSAPHRVLCRLGRPVGRIGMLEHDGQPYVMVLTSEQAQAINLMNGEVARRQLRQPASFDGMIGDAASGQVHVPSGRRLATFSLTGRRRRSRRIGGASAVRETVVQGAPVGCLLRDDRLYLVDPANGRVTRTIWYQHGAIIDLFEPAVLRQRSKLLLLDRTALLHVLDVETRRIEATIPVGDDAVDHIFGMSLPGREVVCLISRQRLWDAFDKSAQDLSTAEGPGEQVRYQSQQSFQCWDVAAPEAGPATAYRLEEKVTSVAPSVMENRPVVITGGEDGLVRIRDETGRVIGELYGHRAKVTSLVVWTSVELESMVVSGGSDGTVRTFDLQRNLFTRDVVENRPSAGPPSDPASSRVLEGSSALASGGPWNRQGISTVDMAVMRSSRDSIAVTAGGDDGCIYTWDVAAGKLLDYWFAHPGGALAVATVRTSKRVGGHAIVFSGGGDGAVKAWDWHRGELMSIVWFKPQRRVTALGGIEFGSASALIVGCDNGELHLIALSGRDLALPIKVGGLVEFVVAAESQSKIIVQADGRLTAIALRKGSLAERRPIHLSPLRGDAAAVASLAYGRNSQAWAAAVGDGVLHYDISSGGTAQIEVWSAVRSVEIDDSGLLIVGAADGVAALSVEPGDHSSPGGSYGEALRLLALAGAPLPDLDGRIVSRGSFDTHRLDTSLGTKDDRARFDRGGAAMLPFVGVLVTMVAMLYLAFYLVVPYLAADHTASDKSGRLGTMTSVVQSACKPSSSLYGLPINLCRLLH